ncbi:MAG TPA: DUF6209 family protein [Polyangia bacterium]|nr:DUF6209 family protein [Polyangia bacterium]
MDRSAVGSLTAGGEAIVHYDLARLPTCRATDLQVPAWNVIANWRVDNGLAVSQSVTTDTSSTTRVGTDITIAVQPGHALDLWFYDSDDTACQTWDSNYGRNYSFPIEPGPPTVRFPWPSFDPVVVDTLRAGGPILIDYDIRRLAECRGHDDQALAWDVIAFYSFDGAPAQSQSLTTPSSSTDRMQTPITIMAPAGAATLTVWFENENNDNTCRAWDSRYGANYVFALQ